MGDALKKTYKIYPIAKPRTEVVKVDMLDNTEKILLLLSKWRWTNLTCLMATFLLMQNYGDSF